MSAMSWTLHLNEKFTCPGCGYNIFYPRMGETCANCGFNYGQPSIEKNSVGTNPVTEYRRTRVYISGPLTTGMLTKNVRQAFDAATVLLERGYAVYVPHTNVLWEIVHPATYQTWLDHDFEWVVACDAVLRLPGASKGGDEEVELALRSKIPVYHSLDTLTACEQARRDYAKV